jgi:hypothetical protein
MSCNSGTHGIFQNVPVLTSDSSMSQGSQLKSPAANRTTIFVAQTGQKKMFITLNTKEQHGPYFDAPNSALQNSTGKAYPYQQTFS